MAKLDLKRLKKELLKKQREEKCAKLEAKVKKDEENQNNNFFKDAMSGVTPLSDNNAYHPVIKPKSKPLPTNITEEFIIHDPLSDELEIESVDSSEIISFCRTGIQKGVFRKLRGGKYRISDELDLHGLSLKQAKKVLVYYLQEAIQFEGCCIRIIHGKGNRSGKKKPVLKTYVNHWLSEHERVLAFYSAKPQDGGTGAVYVLLKTNYKLEQ